MNCGVARIFVFEPVHAGLSKPLYPPVEYGLDDSSMTRYVCTICGHQYNPGAGEPAFGIAPGTDFSSLPKNFCCPVCGAGMPLFREE